MSLKYGKYVHPIVCQTVCQAAGRFVILRADLENRLPAIRLLLSTITHIRVHFTCSISVSTHAPETVNQSQILSQSARRR
ncbi:hypothetical protein MAMMFC1_01314 [Methylomusa anaerophila]|uniref:Uncharacterized protein n=1 Tax=Methylomusa anaerophila TaxID=1930071 RepID=A0A348AHV5_9FIRM|nr:hypothetical protein MAMMFC1_01314 [Methylomusa anaerophila]